jgi:ubiquinone/menaquinone biosynthesis C-methylase UbiE
MDDQTNAQEILDEIAGGYRAAQVLFTANRLDLFNALSSDEMTADEIARKTGASSRGIRILCDALVSLDILEKTGNCYCNSEVSRRCLLKDSPNPKHYMYLHGARLYEKWGRLAESVRTGEPVSEEGLNPELDGGKEGFARAMQDSARKSAALLVDKIDFRRNRKLLDLGGGPGLFSIEFCRRAPHLQASIIDNEETLQVAGKNIREAGLEDRISLIPGDMFETGFQNDFDFILISNVIHIYSSEENRLLIEKCFDALPPGGKLCVKDFFFDQDRTGPPWVALFAVNMLVNTTAGNCYTFEEMEGWLSDAGFDSIENQAITPYSSFFLALRN